MKYLVSVNTVDLDSKVAKLFGYCPHFLVVDPETMEFTATSGVDHDEPNHGLNKFAGQDIDRVIVGNIGPTAYREVTNKGWKVYSCHSITAREAVEKVKNDEIPLLSKPTMKVSVHDAQKQK